VTAEFEELARPKVQRKLLEVILQKFPMAAMFLTEQMLEEMLKSKWQEIVAEFRHLAEDEAIRGFLERQIGDAAQSMIGSGGRLLAEEANANAVAGWLAGRLGAVGGQLGDGALAAELDKLLVEAAKRPLGDFVGGADSIARALAPVAAARLGGWLREERGRRWAAERIAEVLREIATREPLCRVIELVPEEDFARVGEVLARGIQQRAMEVLPVLLTEQVDLKLIVTKKVQEFDSDRIEATIQRVSGRELKGIVRLGGLIGILVGAAYEGLEALRVWYLGG
jgi:uncharacterized membrane protein YheB (UPF0754 family)